jgi:tryptophan 2,3-dioxygenase
MTNESNKNENQIQNNDEFWWHYSLDWFGGHEPKNAKSKDENIEELKAELDNFNKSICVNPEEENKENRKYKDSQFHPSYTSYIRPKEILSQQIPISTNPEERVFIIVHEMYELAFKQMIFDLDIVSKTLGILADKEPKDRPPLSNEMFRQLVELKIPVNYEQYNDAKLFSIVQDIWNENKLSESEPLEKRNKLEEKEEKKSQRERNLATLHFESLGLEINNPEHVDRFINNYRDILFWQAAYFASNRLIVNAEKVLSALSCLLDITAFSGLQFSQFRPLLLPASGFQTEQFRTVQMILGKAPCFNYKFFGMIEYMKKYKAYGKDEAWKDINEMDKGWTAQKIVEDFFYSVTDKQLHHRTELDKKTNKNRNWESISATAGPKNALNVEKQNDKIKVTSKLCETVNQILINVYNDLFKEYKNCYEDGKIQLSKNNNSSKIRNIKLKAFEFCLDDFLKHSDPFLNAKAGDPKKQTFDDTKTKVMKEIKKRILEDTEKNIREVVNSHWKGSFRKEQRIGMQLLVDHFRDSFLLHILSNLSILDTTLHAIDHTKRNKERNLRTSIINRPYYSFLERHVDFIDNQIGIVMDYERGGAIGGSGGGGKNYFEFAMRLYELFPAFPAVDEYIVK